MLRRKQSKDDEKLAIAVDGQRMDGGDGGGGSSSSSSSSISASILPPVYVYMYICIYAYMHIWAGIFFFQSVKWKRH